ncbi:MAG: EAL domain-containing protein, partial [Micromonosporaceae bacterium]|nr:EAL domain-containing protein [Micromonosporaceae bacterium]
APPNISGKLRMALDGSLVAAALFGTAYQYVLAPMSRAAGSSRQALIDLLYPVLAVAVLAVALLLLLGQPIRRLTAMTAIAGGVAVLATALLVEIAGDITNQLWVAPFMRGGYVAAAVLMSIAPLAPLPLGLDRVWRPSTLPSNLLPYVPVGGFFALVTVRAATGKSLEPKVLWFGGLIVILLLCRQFLALQLNAALAEDLARERTRLAIEATHDALTGLPNRALLNQRLSELDLSDANPNVPALLMIDLDGFKVVNDTLGHAAGDRLLRIVADRLRQTTESHSEAALAARLGGDEFAVLLEDGGLRAAQRLATEILDNLAAPVLVNGRPAAMRASAGIAARTESLTPEALLHHADLALYEAKHHSKGRARLFDRSMAAAIEAQRSLETDLATALARGQFSLVYQPIVDLTSGASSSSEVLLRWHHPHQGVLTPDAFLMAATDACLLPDIDRWVLTTALAQLAEWRAVDHRYGIHVNMSASYLASGTVLHDVTHVLHTNGLPAAALTIELTESSLITNLHEAARTLNDLRTLGVRIALDDFGVGYSSLTYLRELPVDAVKVDRSFIRGLGHDPKATMLVGSVIGLVHGLGLTCVAEGVDHPSQVTHLRTFRCELAQGYLFARPQAPEITTAAPRRDARTPGTVATPYP